MRKSISFIKLFALCIMNTALLILCSCTPLLEYGYLLSFCLSIILSLMFDYRFIGLIISLIVAFLFTSLIYAINAIKDYSGWYSAALVGITPLIAVSESIGFMFLKIIKSNRTRSIQKEKVIEETKKR